MTEYKLGDYVRIRDHDGKEITVRIDDSGIPNRQGGFTFKAGARIFKNSEILGLGEVPVTLAKDLEEQWALMTPAPDTEVHADLVAENDVINSPAHYTSYPVEVIELTEHMNFCRGNAVKYVARAGLKDPAKEVEDLRKAIWYLEREISRVEQAK